MPGTVRIEGENLVLELHGVDRILAFKRSMTIPLKHIVSVSPEKADWKPFQQVKALGTDVPGLVKDGRYVTPEGYAFFEMHNPDECITITLNDEEYKRIIFQVKDKESAATLIREVISSTT
jgi:hypothetical protein